jgi:hypothetical protein
LACSDFDIFAHLSSSQELGVLKNNHHSCYNDSNTGECQSPREEK